MGARRGGPGGGRSAGVLKERANMSFMLVVMFFAVFGLIVLTEIFLIDDRHGSNVGGTGALGGHRNGHRNGHRLIAAPDRPDYEEVGAEDYTGVKGGFDDHVGLLVKDTAEGGKPVASLADPRGLPSLPTNVESRLPHLNQSLRLTHADWLNVTNTRFKFFVYSAYYDNRANGGEGPGLIRVIGATKTRGPEQVWCRLWYNLHATGNATASITVSAKVKTIRENWNLKYSATFVICPLPKTPPETAEGPVPNAVPNSVSVVSRLKAPPAHRILIQNRPSDRPNKKEPLAVCVKPLHFEFNRVMQLIEFVELHLLLGATHVTLYNDTLGQEAGCVIRDYESRSAPGSDYPLVTLLPWHHLDMISQLEIRTEGLFAALNDCLYRSMYQFEYVAFLDLDEYIIPRHNDTIPELIRWLGKRVSTKSTGSYSFQNAFFYLQWGDDPSVKQSQTAEEAALITLRKTRRKTKLHPHKQRSKYICKPEHIVEAGNHFVWEFAPGHGTLNVPAEAAILHHYRVCEFGGDDCVKTQSIVDKTAYRYGQDLARNVRTRYAELKEKCSLPDLEPVPAAPATLTESKPQTSPLVQPASR
ncbi:uncharacterized protein [Neodiprion pinetum]|nr:uncharacterized protein LOC107218122 isoform X2 [Neodiprion lecontei]XP_015511373.1 uncharacterized protein LOC107218122 isoform X2 [Neodiprion lecontei]XP_015511375.1 uncharacterized protein LOC107218122 isoform X2 [Neodiprion lecontei]XP_046413319.1 uncharacterized protein LOC124176279 isoform X2 [Neodiprion fabricii]XP_046413320.1 uncharacterized protein LOC124176279 isoform X2 [Neodiprion fabricii]XP_046413321.1 uncharacterized protein LOC124176279 isoform X2 [Neodiprion fabricii]XP_04